MKVRQGFVSNSSSSSFILAVKGDLTKDKLLKAFKVPKDSPMYSVAKDMIDIIICNSKVMTTRELLDDYCVDDIDELPIEQREVIGKAGGKFSMYCGFASSEEGGIEGALCELDINHESDDLIFKKEGGY